MSYRLNTFVNRNEADALKEMIFNRVRQRSESMSEDVQSDVMDIARNSFVSKNNPFSDIAEFSIERQKELEDNITNQTQLKKEEVEGLGFPVRKPNLQQNISINNQIVAKTVESTMADAREGLNKRSGFMGALNFLNTQASISLARTRADKFEMII